MDHVVPASTQAGLRKNETQEVPQTLSGLVCQLPEGWPIMASR